MTVFYNCSVIPDSMTKNPETCNRSNSLQLLLCTANAEKLFHNL